MKLKNNFYLSLMLISLLGSGCTTNLVAQKQAKFVKVNNKIANNQMKAISMPENIRLFYYWQASDGKMMACTQPASDVAKSDSFKSSGNTGVKLSDGAGILKNDVTVEGGVNSSTTVLQLNGRSSAILLARDALFHTCEFAANGWLTEESIKESFRMALAVAQNISEAEKDTIETNNLILKNSLGLDQKILDESAKRLIVLNFIDLAEKRRVCINEAGKDETKIKKCDQDYDRESISLLNK